MLSLRIAPALVMTITFATSAAAEASEDRSPTAATVNSDRSHLAYARVGIDPAFGGALGYGHRLRVGKLERRGLVFGELSSAFASIGKSGAVTTGVLLPIYQAGYFRLATELSFEVGWTHNRNYHSVRLAPGAKLLPGIGPADDRWWVDGVLSFEHAIATHIVHTSFYRQTFYEDAKDGWYGGASGHLGIGIRAGGWIGCVRLGLELVHVRTERFVQTGGSPFAATVSAGVLF